MDGEPSLTDQLIFMNDRSRFTDAEFESALEAVLREHARELAEKIREAAEKRVGWGQPMREAADLIDPGPAVN